MVLASTMQVVTCGFLCKSPGQRVIPGSESHSDALSKIAATIVAGVGSLRSALKLDANTNVLIFELAACTNGPHLPASL